MKRTRRSGFTLVELLIVIVVIGILSAMMMLSSTEAVTSAKASNIVSNLRNLKTAATAMFVDYQDYSLTPGLYDGDSTQSTNSMDLVVQYMNNAADGNDDLKAYGIDKDNTGNWFVYYQGGASANIDSKIQTKLVGRAKSVGLVCGDSSNNNKTYTGGNYVGMWVLKSDKDATN